MQTLIVLAAVTLLIGCGGSGTSSTPVSPDGPGVCRNYASSVTKTTTTTYTGMNPAGTVSTQEITASYNTASNQLSETGTGTSNNGMCRSRVRWLTSYGSVADFVDEVSVIPPKTRWASQSETGMFSGPSGPCLNDTLSGMTTNSYDSQGRRVWSASSLRPSRSWSVELLTMTRRALGPPVISPPQQQPRIPSTRTVILFEV